LNDPLGYGFPPIPLFKRTRTVVWEEEVASYFTFSCSCCQFQRIGIPCVHIYSVAKQIDPDWTGFTHHHVAVRWWTSYISHGFSEDNSPMTQALNALACGDIGGPSIHLLSPRPFVLETTTGPSGPVPAYIRLKNYPQDELYHIFGEWTKNKQNMQMMHKDLTDIGLTQTTFDPNVGNREDDSKSVESNDFRDVNMDDDSVHSCDYDDDSDHLGAGGCKNLFKESWKTNNDAISSDEVTGEVFDSYLRTLGSLYRMVGKSDKGPACTTIATLISQLRGAATKRKKGTDKTLGTQGIVVECHSKRSRTYNTHHDYYR
jgi:SWIM zinc finger